MATSTNSYGNTTGVERLIGDIVVNRAFSTTSVPTLGQVELIIDDVASEMNISLSANGYSVPVSTASDPITHRWLESINNYGAAAITLGTLPMTAIAPGQEGAGANRMEMYMALYNRAINRIEEKKVRSSRSRERVSGIIYTGSQETTDGERKLPIFKRGADKTPGTRSLTE